MVAPSQTQLLPTKINIVYTLKQKCLVIHRTSTHHNSMTLCLWNSHPKQLKFLTMEKKQAKKSEAIQIKPKQSKAKHLNVKQSICFKKQGITKQSQAKFRKALKYKAEQKISSEMLTLFTPLTLTTLRPPLTHYLHCFHCSKSF